MSNEEKKITSHIINSLKCFLHKNQIRNLLIKPWIGENNSNKANWYYKLDFMTYLFCSASYNLPAMDIPHLSASISYEYPKHVKNNEQCFWHCTIAYIVHWSEAFPIKRSFCVYQNRISPDKHCSFYSISTNSNSKVEINYNVDLKAANLDSQWCYGFWLHLVSLYILVRYVIINWLSM